MPQDTPEHLPLVVPTLPSYDATPSTTGVSTGQRRSVWGTALLGQVLSLLITGTGVTSELLARRGVRIPTAQSFANYFLLAVSYTSILLWKRRKPLVEQWKYCLLAVVDVEANFLLVKAYQLTSITSVMLLDCFTIPCVMILSRVFLKARFNQWHLGGVLFCLAGMSALAVDDANRREKSEARDPLLGDVFVLLGAACYAVSNVGQECSVRRVDAIEYLSMLGLWGTLVNGIQLIVLERESLRAVEWSYENVLLLAGFAGCLFTMYTLVPVMLVRGGATFFNLSLLTSDILAVLAGFWLFHFEPTPLYFVSCGIIVSGIVIFNYSNRTGPSVEPVVSLPSVLLLPDDKPKEEEEGIRRRSSRASL